MHDAFLSRTAGLVALSFALAAVCGCGAGGGLVEVSGRVTFDGTGLSGANVTFFPTGGDGLQAYGNTDAEGNYSLKSIRIDRDSDAPGVTPGTYQVKITLRAEEDRMSDAGDVAARVYKIPRPWRMGEHTFTVEPGGHTDANFDITRE